MSAMTEETLSVSGVLLAKVFGRQRPRDRPLPGREPRLAALQVRQQMIGRMFFAVVSTFFSITPALVYLVAGITLGTSERRHARGVHHPADAAVLSDRADAPVAVEVQARWRCSSASSPTWT